MIKHNHETINHRNTWVIQLIGNCKKHTKVNQTIIHNYETINHRNTQVNQLIGKHFFIPLLQSYLFNHPQLRFASARPPNPYRF
jgi:hypothetical protein